MGWFKSKQRRNAEKATKNTLAAIKRCSIKLAKEIIKDKKLKKMGQGLAVIVNSPQTSVLIILHNKTGVTTKAKGVVNNSSVKIDLTGIPTGKVRITIQIIDESFKKVINGHLDSFTECLAKRLNKDEKDILITIS